MARIIKLTAIQTLEYPGTEDTTQHFFDSRKVDQFYSRLFDKVASEIDLTDDKAVNDFLNKNRVTMATELYEEAIIKVEGYEIEDAVDGKQPAPENMPSYIPFDDKLRAGFLMLEERFNQSKKANVTEKN